MQISDIEFKLIPVILNFLSLFPEQNSEMFLIYLIPLCKAHQLYLYISDL